MLAAAPSHATVKASVNGFTGAFSSANWTKTPGNVNNTVTVAPTQLTITKNNGNSATPFASIVIDQDLIDGLRPSGAGAFLGWTANAKYTWTGTNLNRLAFVADSNTDSESFNNGATAVSTPTAFSLVGEPVLDDGITFLSTRLTTGAAIGTGNISDFQFVAEYEVPGPLPIVGAAAAFAWSRRLRTRLKSAKTLA
jgi:hypothetical protein